MSDYVSVVVVGSDNEAKCIVANVLCQRKGRFKLFHCKKLYEGTVKKYTIQGSYPRVITTPCLGTPLWRKSYKELYSNRKYSRKCFLYVKDLSAIHLDDTEVLRSLKVREQEDEAVVIVIPYRIGKTRVAEREQANFQSLGWKTFLLNCSQSFENMFSLSFQVLVAFTEMKNFGMNIGTLRYSAEDLSVGGSLPNAQRRQFPQVQIVTQEEEQVELHVDSVCIKTDRDNLSGHRPGTPSADSTELNEKHYWIYRKAISEGRSDTFYTRVNVVGYQDAGKTTLVKRLKKIDVNIQESPRPTECLEIDKTTSRCTETNEGLIWETNSEGYDRNLNYQRMVASIKSVIHPSEYNNRNDALKVEETLTNVTLYEQDLGDASLHFGSEEVEGETAITDTPDWDLYHRHRVKKEYLKMVVNKLENSPHMRRYISYWDFAGQSTYYTTHQAFLAPDAVYLLVVDLSKPLDDELQNSLSFRTKNFLKTTVLDAIRFWAGSIKAFASDRDNTLAPMIVVGTHADKVDDASINSIFDEVKETLGQSDLPCVAIDNTIPVCSDERLEELRNRILDKALGVLEKEVKAHWIELEFLLILEKDDRQEAIIDMGRLYELNYDLENPLSETELLEFLDYEHCNGFLMFFDIEGIDNIIILQQNIFVDFINLILRQKNDSSVQGWNRDGTFDAVFLENSIKGNHYLQKHADVLVKLLQHLKIIFPTRHSQKDTTYLMPCLFGERPKQADTFGESCQKSPLLRISFAGKLIPPAFFHSLIVSLLSCRMELDSKQDQKGKNIHQLFYHYSRFKLTKAGGTLLEMYWTDSVIIFQFIHMSKITKFEDADCAGCLERIETSIQEILKTYRHYNIEYSVDVKCPSQKHDSFISFSGLRSHKEYSCSGGKSLTVHMVSEDEVFSNWIKFKDDSSLSEKDVVSLSGAERTDKTNRKPGSSKPRKGILAKEILDRMVTEKDLTRLSSEVGNDYVLLFVELGLPTQLIEQVKENHKTSKTTIFYLFLEWKRKCAENATVRSLVCALEKAGLNLSDWREIFLLEETKS